MKADYNRDIFKQLEETLNRLDKMESTLDSILNKSLLTANFRRKIADHVLETEESVEGAGHHPAKKFKRNVKRFYRM